MERTEGGLRADLSLRRDSSDLTVLKSLVRSEVQKELYPVFQVDSPRQRPVPQCGTKAAGGGPGNIDKSRCCAADATEQTERTGRQRGDVLADSNVPRGCQGQEDSCRFSTLLLGCPGKGSGRNGNLTPSNTCCRQKRSRKYRFS